MMRVTIITRVWFHFLVSALSHSFCFPPFCLQTGSQFLVMLMLQWRHFSSLCDLNMHKRIPIYLQTPQVMSWTISGGKGCGIAVVLFVESWLRWQIVKTEIEHEEGDLSLHDIFTSLSSNKFKQCCSSGILHHPCFCDSPIWLSICIFSERGRNVLIEKKRKKAFDLSEPLTSLSSVSLSHSAYTDSNVCLCVWMWVGECMKNFIRCKTGELHLWGSLE